MRAEENADELIWNIIKANVEVGQGDDIKEVIGGVNIYQSGIVHVVGNEGLHRGQVFMTHISNCVIEVLEP